MATKIKQGLDKRIEDYLMKEENGLWNYQSITEFILKEKDMSYIKGLNDAQESAKKEIDEIIKDLPKCGKRNL